MRNARIARIGEGILGLVTTEDRAASTVGDLMEEVQTRGLFWFWASVAGTAISIMWRDVRAEPGKMVWLAVRAWAFQIICAVGWFLLYGLADRLSRQWRRSPGIPPWSSVAFLAAGLVIALLAGRWIARRARGRELAACFALAAVGTVLEAALPAAIRHSGANWDVQFDTLSWAAGLLPLFAGAMWVRQRSGIARTN
jgi:hypothetical protein